MSVQHYDEKLEKIPSQYIVCLASCLTKKLDPKTEPLYFQICKQFPHANIYSRSEKRQPGTFQIQGDGIKNRRVLIILSQIYPGKMYSPSDSKSRRLTWFKDALDDISTLQDLKSICFLNQLSRDCGGNWSEYYQAIADFSQTVNLKSNVDVSIGYLDGKKEPEKVTQISLINCFNPERVVTLDKIRVAHTNKTEKIVAERDILDIRGPKKKTKQSLNFKSSNQPQENGLSSSSDKPPEDQPANQLLEESEDEVIPKGKLKFKAKSQKLETLSPSSEEDHSDGDLISENPNPFPTTKLNDDWVLPITKPRVHPSWKSFFENEEIQQQLQTTQDLLAEELKSHGNKTRFVPEFNSIFKAFQICSFKELKICIIGQDPYANQLHAMGLSFSVPEGNGIPKSLANIFKEIKNEYPETYKTPSHGNLEKWAEQGILLLNSALTVREKDRNSHQSYWRGVTDLIIQLISDLKEKPVIFVLWGGDAKKKKSLINTKRHIVLESNHPSPLSAYKGFFGNNHFKKINTHLENMNLDPIDWQT